MDIAILRLFNQRISLPVFDQPGEVVAWLGAVQAADASVYRKLELDQVIFKRTRAVLVNALQGG